MINILSKVQQLNISENGRGMLNNKDVKLT